jgi:hypothetical protein
MYLNRLESGSICFDTANQKWIFQFSDPYGTFVFFNTDQRKYSNFHVTGTPLNPQETGQLCYNSAQIDLAECPIGTLFRDGNDKIWVLEEIWNEKPPYSFLCRAVGSDRRSSFTRGGIQFIPNSPSPRDLVATQTQTQENLP